MRRANRTLALVVADQLSVNCLRPRQSAAVTSEANALSASNAASARQKPSSSNMGLFFRLQLTSLVLDEAVQLIEQFTVALADGIDETGHDGFGAFRAAPEQPVNDVLRHLLLKLLARDAGR